MTSDDEKQRERESLRERRSERERVRERERKRLGNFLQSVTTKHSPVAIIRDANEVVGFIQKYD